MSRALPLLPLVVLAVSSGVLAQPAPAPAPQADAQPDAGAASATATQASGPALLERADALHRRRDDPAAARELVKLLETALKAEPRSYDLLWRLARQKHWEADGAADKRLKKQLGREAWDLAERAVAVRPEGFEGHYFAAIGIGAYSQAVGILKALSEGLEGKFNDHIDKALALNPDYDGGAPRLVKGRYHHELPWPKRSYSKAKAYFNEAIARFPSQVRGYYFLAETQLADGDAKDAKQTLERLAKAPPSPDGPEDRRIRALAKELEKKVQEELE